MNALTAVEIIDNATAVRLSFADGTSARFHAVWLRDNSPDGETRSPANGQRLITVLDLPQALRISEAEPSVDGASLTLHFDPEGKATVFAAAWLEAHIYDRALPNEPGWTAPHVTLWGRELETHTLRIDFTSARTDPARLGAWLAGVRRYGFAVMTGITCKSGALANVVDLFGYIRETNYGRWFDVRAEVNPSNLAYTNLGLQGPHRQPLSRSRADAPAADVPRKYRRGRRIAGG